MRVEVDPLGCGGSDEDKPRWFGVTARSAGQTITNFTGPLTGRLASSRTRSAWGLWNPAHTKEGMIPNERKPSEMSVVLVATAFLLPSTAPR
jgi:hypothetical protein